MGGHVAAGGQLVQARGRHHLLRRVNVRLVLPFETRKKKNLLPFETHGFSPKKKVRVKTFL